MTHACGSSLLLSVLVVGFVAGCSVYIGGIPGEPSSATRPVTVDLGGGDGGVQQGPRGVPAGTGEWTVLGAPALSDGVARAVAVARDVWIVGSQSVLRVDSARDQLEAVPAAVSLAGASLVFPGENMVLGWGRSAGARYLLAQGAALPLGADNAPDSRSDAVGVWTGNALLVWGGASALGRLGDGAAWVMTADRWVPLAATDAPQARAAASAVWTGTQMLVFGGRAAGDVPLGDGARYSPAVDAWRPLELLGAPASRYRHSAVWTGSEMIVWGGQGDDGVRGDGAAYDPARSVWRAINVQGAPSARAGHVAVWTGSRMVVWGGVDAHGELADGSVYDPGADQWTAIPAVTGVAPRQGAAAVWTGREMVIAGGTHNGAPVAQVAIWRTSAVQ